MTVGSELFDAQEGPKRLKTEEDRNSAADASRQERTRDRVRAIDTMTALASQLFGAPAAAVAYEEDDLVRVVSAVGELPLEPGQRITTNGYLPPRLQRLHRSGLLVIRDLERHREAGCEHVLPSVGVRAILGAPIFTGDGATGLICVLDRDPREWTTSEREMMRSLANAASRMDVLAGLGLGDGRGAPGGGDAALDPPAQLDSLLRFFEDSPSAGVIATGRGEIVRCNAEFAHLFGFETPQAARGEKLIQLERAPGSFVSVLRRLERGEILNTETFEVQRRNGERTEVLATVAGTLDERGELAEIRAYLTDITDARQTERALRTSQELFDLVEAATQDVLWVWDLADESLEWNSGGPRRFRYAPEEMRHTIDWHVQRIHPEDRDRVVRGIQTMLQGLGTLWTAEYRFRRGDGSFASVLDRACVVRGARGEPLRVIGWMLDVSQWREAEDAHRFLASASGILESTLDLTDALEGIAKETVGFMADYCRLDLVNDSGEPEWVASYPVIEGDDEGGTLDFLRRVLGRPELDPLGTVLGKQEMVLLRAADPSAAAANPLELPSGSPDPDLHAFLLVPIINRSGTVGLLTLALSSAVRSFQPVDLIRARELARLTGLAVENCRLYETARQAVLDREELLRFVSHDLRNPLHAIVSAVSLARDSKSEGVLEGKRWLDPIERAADQMRRLLEDLLDTAGIESGNFTLEPAWNSLETLATTACEVLQPMAEAKGIDLVCEIEPDLPQVWVDFQQFLRVLSNLLVNALKFTESGGTVRLHARMAESEATISVTDSGPGIPEEELKAVFTKYWQGRPGDRRGAGLGLSIARGIVEAHGGRAWVESEPGTGATFFVTIPAGAGALAGDSERSRRRQRVGGR